MVDLEPPSDHFDHHQVSTFNAKYNGIRLFDDCLGTCRFAAPEPKLALRCLNAVTGWDLSLEDGFRVGLRIVNLLRVFNLRHGLEIREERPSARYGSPPVDGPAKGVDITAKWPEMMENYYTLMGWDPATGRPTPETLAKLDLTELADQY
jgi:aldehyde:ferredoxin oxidoreductase